MNNNPISPTPEQLAQWMLHANHPTDNQARQCAVRDLQHWNNTTRPVHAFPLLLPLLQHTRHEVQFHALTILASHPFVHNSDTEAAYFRNFLRTHYLLVPNRAAEEPSFLRNKKAQLLAAHMMHDTAWSSSSLRTDVEQKLATTIPLLFLQTLLAVLEEFQTVSRKHHNDGSALGGVATSSSVADNKTTTAHTRRFKEVLKGYSTDATPATTTSTVASSSSSSSSSTATTTLLESLFALTVRLLEASTDDERMASTALQTIAAFFRWTDVSFLGPTDVVARCFDLLLAAMVPTNAVLPVQLAAVQAFQEYTTTHTSPRGSHDAMESPIDPTILARLLTQIHVSQHMPYPQQPGKKSTEAAAQVDGATMELVIGLAHCITNVGTMLLLEAATTTTSMSALWPQVLDLFLRCFAYDDIDVTAAVLPLALRIVPLLATHQQQQLPLFLNTLYEQMKYPVDFGYNFSDDEDAEEEMFRIELAKVYDKLVESAPATCLQFLCEAVTAHCTAAAAATTPTPDAEATLRLVHRYCDGVRPRPGLKTILQNDTFRSLLLTIHASTITQHPHGHVLCLYYEMTVRYAALFSGPDAAAALLPILHAMTTRGLQHADARVRSRCCYLLSRLVHATLHLLSPLVASSLDGIQGFLTQQQQRHGVLQDLGVDDTLFLYETMGLLIGKTNQAPLDQQRYLVAAMTPLMRSMEEQLTQQVRLATRVGPESSSEMEALATSLTGSVAAIAYISKGFRKPCGEVRDVFAGTVATVLRVLESGSQYEELRNKTMVYLQRMVQCVGKDLLQSGSSTLERFLSILVSTATAEDILFVSQLMNNLCASFGKDALGLMDVTVLPFLQRCETLVVETDGATTNPDEEEAPHVCTEKMRVQKLVYSVLHHVVNKDLSPLLVSSRNVGSFLPILQSVGQGAVEHADAAVRKTCIKFFQELLLKWAAQDKEQVDKDQHYNTLLSFVCQCFVPGFLKLVLSKSFDKNDANNARGLSEFCVILDELKSNPKSKALYSSTLASACHGLSMPQTVYEVLVSGMTSRQEMEKELLRPLTSNP